MAVTVTNHAGTGPGIAGTRPMYAASGGRALKVVTGTIAFDSSYPTGGEATTAISGHFTELLGVLFEHEDGYTFKYDYTNNKILAYWVDTSVDGAAQAEVADTTDLSGVTALRFFAWGI